MVQRMLQHSSLSDTCCSLSSTLQGSASMPLTMQSAAAFAAPAGAILHARIHTTPPANMPRRKGHNPVDTLQEVEENLRSACDITTRPHHTALCHPADFQQAADTLMGGQPGTNNPLAPPPGLPEIPFEPSEDPLDIPEDPEERHNKLQRLLREASGKWQESMEQRDKPDPVGEYIQRMIAKTAKLFEAQKFQEGLKALEDGVRKAEQELGTSSIHMTLAWDHVAMMQLVCGEVERALESSKHAVQVAEKSFKGKLMLPVAACLMRQAVIQFSACSACGSCYAHTRHLSHTLVTCRTRSSPVTHACGLILPCTTTHASPPPVSSTGQQGGGGVNPQASHPSHAHADLRGV